MARSNGTGWLKWIIILLLLGGAGYGGWRWYGKHEQEAAAIEYKTSAVARGDLVQQVTANGQISPVKNVAVAAHRA